MHHEQSKSNGDPPTLRYSSWRDQIVCFLSHYSDLWHHQVCRCPSFRKISPDVPTDEDIHQDQHRTQSTTLSSGGASSAIFALLQRAARVAVDPCPSRDLRRDVDLFASHRQESSGSRLCRNAFPPGSTRADLLGVQKAAWNFKTAWIFGAALDSHLLILAAVVPATHWHAMLVSFV